MIFSSARTARSVAQNSVQYAPEGGGSLTAGGGGTLGSAGGIGLDGVAQPVNISANSSSSALGSHSIRLAPTVGRDDAAAPAVFNVAGVLGVAQSHREHGSALAHKLVLCPVEEEPEPGAAGQRRDESSGQRIGHASFTLTRAMRSGTGSTGTGRPAG